MPKHEHKDKDSGKEKASSQNELDELRKKCEEYLNGWKRERADFLNHKKEEAERISQLVKYAAEEMALKLLPIVDNICIAEQHAPADSDWAKGFLQIKKQILDFLAKAGVEPIDVAGKPFDPALMEIIADISPESVGDPSSPKSESVGDPSSHKSDAETMVEEVQKGYTLNGKVIRPAKVKVTKQTFDTNKAKDKN